MRELHILCFLILHLFFLKFHRRNTCLNHQPKTGTHSVRNRKFCITLERPNKMCKSCSEYELKLKEMLTNAVANELFRYFYCFETQLIIFTI